jgi:3-oxoacyl-[acyl-carrier-protein] synthase-3
LIPVRIATLRYDLPGPVVSDGELAAELGCGAAELQSYSAGRLRYSAPDGEGPSHLALRATRAALQSLGRDVADLDFIVFATNTPDYFFPGSACCLQAMLEAPTIGCLDVRSQCTNFIVGLDVASRFVATGAYGRIALAVAEVPSHHNRMDGHELTLAAGMSDAAVVALLEPGEGSGQLLSAVSAVDGSRHKEYWCEAPASRHIEGPEIARGHRWTLAMLDDGRVFPRADLEALRETAARETPALLERALADAGLEKVDAAIVAHVDRTAQARLADVASAKSGRIVEDDVLYSMGASLPLAFERLRNSGALEAGETVALLTSGSGASWGAAILVA